MEFKPSSLGSGVLWKAFTPGNHDPHWCFGKISLAGKFGGVGGWG